MSFGTWVRAVTAVGVTAVALQVTPGAQDRLKSMPGYDQFEKMSTDIPRAGVLARHADHHLERRQLDVRVRPRRQALSLRRRDAAGVRRRRCARRPGRGGRARLRARPGRGNGQPQPARGRQFDSAESPDKKLKAFYKDRNLWLSDADGSNAVALTTDGNEKDRIKYGTASWVYGEELEQRTAMWWSPDSRSARLLPVRRKAGPRLLPADDADRDPGHARRRGVSQTRQAESHRRPVRLRRRGEEDTTRIDVRDGKPFDDTAVGHYVYDVELVARRHGAAVEPDQPPAERPRVRRVQPGDRQVPRDRPRGMADGLGREQPGVQIPQGRQALHLGIASATAGRTSISTISAGKLLAPLTTATSYEAANIVRVDEESEPAVLHGARRRQLHEAPAAPRRARRQGRPPADRSRVQPHGDRLARRQVLRRRRADARHAAGHPPDRRRRHASLPTLAKSDLSKFEQLGLKKVEMFTYKAADGQTTLHGLIHFPSNFDPSKKYPVLASVYGGPAATDDDASDSACRTR